MTKQCTCCKVERPLELFSRDSSRRDGLCCRCKVCVKKYHRTYYQAHKDIDWHKWRRENRDRNNANARALRQAHPERNAAATKAWREKNPGRQSAISKTWREANAERYANTSKNWRLTNRGRVAANRIARHKKRMKTDLNYRLRFLLRQRIHKAIKRGRAGSPIRDLGCSINELRMHIEKQFQPGMTWQNWGLKGWHIDHKEALAKFDLTERDQFLRAVHYTNLQPLWWRDNLAKGCH